ncbi:MAG: thiamine-phosphate kinase [Rikenellaceae bacterium]
MTEFGFIDQIKALCESLPKCGCEGIGDDCAVMPIGGGRSLHFTGDMLVERVHFLREATSPYDLGRKSLAVNLSDVASMGARPVATLLSLSIPSELMGGWIEEFMRGYRDLSLEHGVALIGGDTTASKLDLAINITAIGESEDHLIKRRSGARVGDLIVVTGDLGGSGRGLRDLLNGHFESPAAQLHKRPTARVNEGQWLARWGEIHSMMDISDGVASDLRHILKASDVGAEVELSLVPISKVEAIEEPNCGALRDALSAGEDYELLFTCEAEAFERLATQYKERFGQPLSQIGKIVAGAELVWLDGGVAVGDDFSGFTHY